MRSFQRMATCSLSWLSTSGCSWDLWKETIWSSSRETCWAHTCISTSGTGELRQLSPLTVLMSRCLIFWNQNILYVQVTSQNTLETLPPSECVLNLTGLTSLVALQAVPARVGSRLCREELYENVPGCAKLAWALHCQLWWRGGGTRELCAQHSHTVL